MLWRKNHDFRSKNVVIPDVLWVAALTSPPKVQIMGSQYESARPSPKSTIWSLNHSNRCARLRIPYMWVYFWSKMVEYKGRKSKPCSISANIPRDWPEPFAASIAAFALAKWGSIFIMSPILPISGIIFFIQFILYTFSEERRDWKAANGPYRENVGERAGPPFNLFQSGWYGQVVIIFVSS